MCMGRKDGAECQERRGEEEAHGGGVILPAIVCLEGDDELTELSVDIGNKGTKSGKNIGFISKWNCP